MYSIHSMVLNKEDVHSVYNATIHAGFMDLCIRSDFIASTGDKILHNILLTDYVNLRDAHNYKMGQLDLFINNTVWE